jgi:hypothetical protein
MSYLTSTITQLIVIFKDIPSRGVACQADKYEQRKNRNDPMCTLSAEKKPISPSGNHPLPVYINGV